MTKKDIHEEIQTALHFSKIKRNGETHGPKEKPRWKSLRLKSSQEGTEHFNKDAVHRRNQRGRKA